MKHCLIFLLLLTTSCSTKEFEEKSFVYFVTNNKGLRSGIKQDDFKYKVTLKMDSLKIYKNEQFLYRFKYKVDEKGIFIIEDDIPKLLYSFELNKKIKRDNLEKYFLEEVELVETKTYKINNKSFLVYHFLECDVSETLDSYYLIDEGFICFYKYDSDDFIYLDSPKAKELSSVFFKDSVFFAQLKLRKLDKEMGRKFD